MVEHNWQDYCSTTTVRQPEECGPMIILRPAVQVAPASTKTRIVWYY